MQVESLTAILTAFVASAWLIAIYGENLTVPPTPFAGATTARAALLWRVRGCAMPSGRSREAPGTCCSGEGVVTQRSRGG